MSERAKVEREIRHHLLTVFHNIALLRYEEASAKADDMLRAAIGPLEDEISRLTCELEEAREIICDLADDEDAGLVWLGKRLACAYCDADGLYSVAHADDCPIVRGRRALGPRKERRSEGESKGTVGPLLRGGHRKGDAR